MSQDLFLIGNIFDDSVEHVTIQETVNESKLDLLAKKRACTKMRESN